MSELTGLYQQASANKTDVTTRPECLLVATKR